MEKRYDSVDYYLITYPRSGKNWLEWYFKTNTNIEIIASHYAKVKNKEMLDVDKSLRFLKNAMQNSNKIISTTRDPINSLVSINIMEEFRHMEQRYFQYIDHYEYILNNHRFIFDFEDVKHNTKKIVEFLSQDCNKKLNIVNESFDDYSKHHISVNPPGHLITSVNDKRYAEALETVKKWNLKKHNDLYLEAKNISIKF
jgi:hypothetical protein